MGGMDVTEHRPEGLIGDADLSAIGALLADSARCRVLLALADGRALPASVLANEAGVSPATASSHLRKLVEAGLLVVTPRGRFRYYSLAGPQVGELIEVLARISPQRPVRSLREGTRAHAIRYARRCYDHLAGRVGVAVTAALLEQGALAGPDAEIEPVAPWLGTTAPTLDPAGYTLTTGGRATLHRLGVTAPDDPVVVCCVDWTEQRHHLGGPLGRALLDRFLQLGWLQPSRRSRAVHLTQDGIRGLRAELGAELPNPSPADPARAAPTA